MEDHKLIEKISKIILSELDNIDQNLSVSKTVTENVFVHSDSISESHTQQASLINTQNIIHNEQIKLRREPFIAYVRAEIDGNERVYYICRSYTPSEIQTYEPSGVFVNYRSPIGRIVELDVDDEEIIRVLGREREVRVLEKNLFIPKKIQSKWDGIRNNFFLVSGTYSIPSLLDFIKTFVTIVKDQHLIQDIQEREKQLEEAFLEKLKIKEGLNREVIEKMELRDQAILDETQGNIFRLSLRSQIILTGAPGTGKTTTLIKRIAQKTDPIHLSDEEKYDLPEQTIADYFNEENWIMFTPTELLKMFLKEAFNNELIPASDKRVKIWDDERTTIGRDILKFLKTGEKGYFIKTSRQTLIAQSNIDLINHAKAFIKFYNQFIIDLFYKSYETLKNNNISPRMHTRFSQIKAKLENAIFQDEDDKTFSLIEGLSMLRDAFNSKRKELDDQIEQIINGIIGSKSGILDEIYKYIQSYKIDEFPEDTDVDEDDDVADDSEEHIETTEYNIISKHQIKRTLNFYAEKIASNRRMPKESIHSGVLNIISSFLPTNENLSELGKQIIDRKATNTLTRGYSNLINRIPFYYQRFRIQELGSKSSFFNSKYEKEIRNRKICTLEIDLIIFVILRNARKIFEKHKELLEINSKVDILEEIKYQYSTQISVDEATDFSTIQLGCMYYLSHPRFTSVSLSGDLMQRISDFGLKDWKECDFINENFEIHKVNKVYRQSPKLLKIAELLYENNVQQSSPFRSAFIPNDSDPTPLKFEPQDDEKVAEWIANRILEIFKIRHKLPSTAIFVADDDLIDHAFRIVEEPLNDISIGVKACHRGEILGSEGKVRIFSVKYIKGLEFESVFFLNINKIAERMPNLIDKYLYVGLTRAASFLGVVYQNQFPDEIRFVEDYFKEGDWSRFT